MMDKIIACVCGHRRTSHDIGANLPWISGMCHCGCPGYEARIESC